MKHISASILLVFITAFSFGQTGFEGEIVMETQTAKTKETATVVLQLKGSDTRMNVSSRTADYNSEYAIVVDAIGAFMVSEGIVTDLDPAKFNQPANPKMKLVGTNDGVVKNGFNTVEYIFSDGNTEAHYWVADEFGVSYNQLPAMFKSGVTVPEGGFKGMPVAVEMLDDSGSVKSSQQLISVTSKEVSTSVFKRQ